MWGVGVSSQILLRQSLCLRSIKKGIPREDNRLDLHRGYILCWFWVQVFHMAKCLRRDAFTAPLCWHSCQHHLSHICTWVMVSVHGTSRRIPYSYQTRLAHFSEAAHSLRALYFKFLPTWPEGGYRNGCKGSYPAGTSQSRQDRGREASKDWQTSRYETILFQKQTTCLRSTCPISIARLLRGKIRLQKHRKAMLSLCCIPSNPPWVSRECSMRSFFEHRKYTTRPKDFLSCQAILVWNDKYADQ